jgi:hypothetical protein
MWKVTLKGIWAKKVRFLLTGFAVMLGVAFISGTFVLTATISNTFDGLFSDIYSNTDAVVRAQETFKGDFGGGRGRISADLLPTVRSADGVAQAAGTVQGIAVIVDQSGDALGSNGQGAPTLGFAWIRQRDLSTLHLVAGKAPTRPDDVVIDKKSADDAGYKPGDTVPVLTKDGRADYIAHYGPNRKIQMIEVDEDYDAWVDRWEYYDAAGTLQKVGRWRRVKGRPDIWRFPGKDGIPVRIEYDEDGDGRVDRAEVIADGRTVQVEIDADRDGRMDRWQIWKKGRLVSEDLDTKGTGKPDRRLAYGPAGQVVRVERLNP